MQDRHGSGSPQTSNNNDVAIAILTKEYDTIMAELHYIHNQKITIAKQYATLVMVLLGYTLTGIVTYLQLQKNLQTNIPASLAYAYVLLGSFFALLIYTMSYYLYCHLISHKKHLVRYWKAIHVIRQGFADLCPQVDKYLLLPKYEQHKKRPHMSNRWEVGIYVYPAYNCMFYIILSILISPIFVIDSNGLLYPPDETKSFVKAQVLLLPFLITALGFGSNIMKAHWKNIEAARNIILENIFPEVLRLDKTGLNMDENFYTDSKYSTTIRQIIATLYIIFVIITLFPAISLAFCPHDIIKNPFWWYLEIFDCIFISIILEALFVQTYREDFKAHKNQCVDNKKS